jgi:hypothetical protein
MARRRFPGSVVERLRQKLETVERFARDGVPAGVTVPRTLHAFATWHDEGLGLYPVGSPNDVATTHPAFGEVARQALKAIRAIVTARPSVPPRPKRLTLAAENAATLPCAAAWLRPPRARRR